MSSQQKMINASCTACRMAKVKCETDKGCHKCRRCERSGIECIRETRRSKWDSRKAKDSLGSTRKATVPEAPRSYARLIENLSRLDASSAESVCFRYQTKEQLTQLIGLCIDQNDAATLSWALGQAAAHRLTLKVASGLAAITLAFGSEWTTNVEQACSI